jgi:hypothetical protein
MDGLFNLALLSFIFYENGITIRGLLCLVEQFSRSSLTWRKYEVSKILGFHAGEYEECHLLGYSITLQSTAFFKI